MMQPPCIGRSSARAQGNLSWGSLMSTQSSLGAASDWVGGARRAPSCDLQDIRSRANLVAALVDPSSMPMMIQHQQPDDRAAFMAIQSALHTI